jgi:hypothetical protein
MTAKTLLKATKSKKPAIIKEGGIPRYVVLDWSTYRIWEELRDDFYDSQRLQEAISDSKNQKKISWENVQKKLVLK